MKTKNYKLTSLACFIGITNQAIIVNLTAILFVPFSQLYGFELWQLGLLVGINFGAQFLADLLLTVLIDKLKFRFMAILALSLSLMGLIFYAAVPTIMPNSIFIGFVLATLIFSFASGMLEVILSPIIDNIPQEDSKKKGAAMAFMHSFYAWGQLLTIIVTSIFLFLFDFNNWIYVVLFWTVVPIIGIILFARCPLEKQVVSEKSKSKTLISSFFIVLMIAILMGGAAEIVMNQYVSTFVELSLGFDKLSSDLLGMGLFALFMGLGRIFYGFFGKKINIQKVLIVGAAASFVCFLVAGLSVNPYVSLVACALTGLTTSLLWPGTLVLASEKTAGAGAWVFAVLSLCGDFGASVAPMAVGFLADKLTLSIAISIASIIPFIALISHILLTKIKPKNLQKELLA